MMASHGYSARVKGNRPSQRHRYVTLLGHYLQSLIDGGLLQPRLVEL